MEKVFQYGFGKIYSLLVAKALRKGRSAGEVEAVTSWLTGYSPEKIRELEKSDITYADFFRQAPDAAANSALVTGSICSVRLESIEDPLMRQIRSLDKFVDELARGKALDKVIRKG